ncbi:hypothetical protein CONCODRAFT_77230 [Conidiobolus coronatus NRRL 28638]|uniref:Uncharacterized protein n=1 Tax=Conidiobolus coronatus (strain ATCC 28846 / CBS 209.66 / NRRL 28638) TaxID=796925 RepID=A0A137PFH8_CONC2|nr:hypothetical protein CONCODRAFT_77230 [Conidiobolus coronatus NRRL 28638]|eukprot:KXN73753.1 hypothetical protein CONCODRAFT_77230 [Conidiobolus coronatus NRRL 28638]
MNLLTLIFISTTTCLATLEIFDINSDPLVLDTQNNIIRHSSNNPQYRKVPSEDTDSSADFSPNTYYYNPFKYNY